MTHFDETDGPRADTPSDDRTPARPAETPSTPDEPVIYDGLTWASHTEQPAIVAHAPRTGLAYVVDMTGPAHGDGPTRLWLGVFATAFPDLDDAGWPRQDLGTHVDARAAVDAAELHDFSFAETQAMAAGEELLFRGSRRERALDNDDLAILRAHAGATIGGEAASAPDGRPFTRAASFFQAKKTGYKQNADGSYTLSLTLGAAQTPLWLTAAPMGTQLMLGACEIGPETDPDSSEERRQIKDLIRRAALRPTEGPFQEFLLKYDRWGLVKSAMRRDSDALEEAASETLRRLIGVPTRKELEVNRDARTRFERLDREYYEDMARAVRMHEARHTL